MSVPIYFTVPDHIRQAKKEDIFSLPERSGFKTIAEKARKNLKELLSIPETHSIYFFESIKAAKQSIADWTDATGAIPYADIDFENTKALVFPVNAGFGIPSEMAVAVMKQSREEDLEDSSSEILSIYLLGKVCEDLQRRGLQVIRQETDYKFAVLRQMIAAHPALEFAVPDSDEQLKTIIGAKVRGGSNWLCELLEKNRLTSCIDETAGGDQTIYFINYPAHSKEQIEMLSDLVITSGPPSE